MTDEATTAPAGSAGRPRRKRDGYHKRPATPMRFRPDVSAALETEARRERTSKVAIVEGLLIDRYQLTES